VNVEYLVDRILNLGGLLVPIVAIMVGGVISVVALVHKHQERLAKIERGIDPDGPWPQQK
jgi:ABC-type enterochelin transport system permease subunit